MKKILYHGSEKIVKVPDIHVGKLNNDYGQGFYLTEEKELAGEWACKKNTDGFINKYELDLLNLSVLNLNDTKYNIFNWLAILLQNRTFDLDSEISIEAKKYLIRNYLIDYSKYDIIKGYRVDDSYFAIANNFLNNTITLSKLEKSFKLGNLGIQYVLKTKKAFDNIKFINVESALCDKFYSLYSKRDDDARKKYKSIRNEAARGKYISDYISGEKL